MGLNYIFGSGRKIQADNGSAALLRRRTAFLLRGIRVRGGLESWRNVVRWRKGNFLAKRSLMQSVVFNLQAEAVVMEGEEYWPLGQFEPGRAAAGASQHER